MSFEDTLFLEELVTRGILPFSAKPNDIQCPF